MLSLIVREGTLSGSSTCPQDGASYFDFQPVVLGCRRAGRVDAQAAKSRRSSRNRAVAQKQASQITHQHSYLTFDEQTVDDQSALAGIFGRGRASY
jgi:hypothetical protein